MIPWRPPVGDPPLNYLESPSVIQHPDGSWTILTHGGNCCVAAPAGFEAVFAIHYPTHATPQWQMLRSSADQQDGHEYGGATAVRLDSGQWILATANTHRSDWGKPNRLRGGMAWSRWPAGIDHGGMALWGPWTWRDSLYGPIDPACEPIGSCAGIGAPQSASLVRLPWSRELWLYGQDSTRKPPMRIIRFPVDRQTGERIGPPETTTWPQVVVSAAPAGLRATAQAKLAGGRLHPLEARALGATAAAAVATSNDPNVTDVGRASDGCLHALASNRGAPTADSYYGGVRHYVSCPTVTEPAGKTWTLLDWPAWQPEVGVVWDAGWVRDEWGSIVEPMGVVAVWSSPPAHFADQADGWWLIVHTEPLAYRPSTLNQTPVRRETP